ncbi:endolytic transglycosylase MltG [Tengunoibacter tsumagoiensis]|uniref:Endolytic murein transglycosylase n=1 Tax=Tengunoibacter tsumagoiensis TaxID=2014871 RepID=A0A401ZTI7_9CHLR|nr:endolytic transglycosylase MltG [Tengunoibacter tsumagoiensis]GCE10209.1 aminodeoxychorismate lyase [Tengunoibacter tsumagoiensis]
MRRRSLTAFISVLLVAVIIFIGVSWLWNSVSDVFQPASSSSNKPVTVVINKNETTAEIADDLYNKGLIRNALAFRLWARVKGLDTKLEPGIYKNITPGMTISDITDQFLNARPEAARVLVKEGWRLEQIANAFATASPPLVKFKTTDFLNYAHHSDQFPDANDTPILKILPADQKSMEGLLFPDTYDVPVDADATSVLKLLLNTMNSHIQKDNLVQAAQQHQMDPYQWLTMASIVERETASPDYRDNIASVYWNRLYTDFGKAQTAGGELQADPTVQYAADTDQPPKDVQGYWSPLQDKGENIAPKSPWNTYKIQGLPPTPICSPGDASLRSAANPPSTKYVYFVAGSDGKTRFAKTLDEFNNLVNNKGLNN